MATNFSPCKGSYVLNEFPSNVMFGMNGFHVSASGAIQGHHGPLVFFNYRHMVNLERNCSLMRSQIVFVKWLLSKSAITYFYAPVPKDRGHIVLPLSACMSAQT